jgi:uncharacterized membrane protein YkgB
MRTLLVELGVVVHYRKCYSRRLHIIYANSSYLGIEVCGIHYTVDIAGVCKHATTTTSSVLMFALFLCTICVLTTAIEYTLWSLLCNAAAVHYLHMIEMFVLLLLCVCTAIYATVLEQYMNEGNEIAIHGRYSCTQCTLRTHAMSLY